MRFVPAFVAAIGRGARRRAGVLLGLLGLGAWVFARCLRPDSWGRPARAEFFRRLRQSLAGGLQATIVLGLVAGFGVVFQGLYWFGQVGQRGLLAGLLVTVLMRELVPILVGMLVLGRSGMVTIAELGAMRAAGGLRALQLAGVDPALAFAVPAVAAYALAAFTLGVICLVTSLVFGSLVAFSLGDRSVALLGALDDTLRAVGPRDAVIFPAKLLLAGGLVGLIAAYTALSGTEPRATAQLLPVGFVRGVLAVILSSVVLSLAA